MSSLALRFLQGARLVAGAAVAWRVAAGALGAPSPAVSPRLEVWLQVVVMREDHRVVMLAEQQPQVDRLEVWLQVVVTREDRRVVMLGEQQPQVELRLAVALR